MLQRSLLGALLWVSVSGAAVVPNRYIVELTGEPVAELAKGPGKLRALRSAAAQDRRAVLRRQREAIRPLLEQQGATVLAETDTAAHTFIVQVPDAKASQLQKLAGVRHVYPVREFKMKLDRALPLLNVPAAWAAIGGPDQAGLGVKIGIIDSGIDRQHPGFQDSSLPAPDGFSPQVNEFLDPSFPNGKIIVARSYVRLLRSDPDLGAQDHMGHGTAVAMTAAGLQNAGPLATITGVAPKAYLGVYKVFGSPGVNDSTSDAAILKAVDDAVADGMNVINLSLGDDLAPSLEEDIEVQALERASAAGVVVVVAAGNNGPDAGTIGSPATAPSAIAVGATRNDRVFGAAATVEGLGQFAAQAGSASKGLTSVSGPLADASRLSPSGLACDKIDSGAFTDRIAVIRRGTCTFETKLNTLRAAGAVAAIVINNVEGDETIEMSVASATLPALMVGNTSSGKILAALADNGSLTASLQFTPTAYTVDARRLAGFSSAGPSVDNSVKPDVLAVGTNVYMATQKADSKGDMYGADGYTSANGTSFASPLVAGAAALIRGARPSLAAAQIRSLLINSASPFLVQDAPVSAQAAGAGLLDVANALRSNVAVAPTSLAFGLGPAGGSVTRSLTLTNLGSTTETYALQALSLSSRPAPSLGNTTLTLEPNASVTVPVTFDSSLTDAGAYEGVVQIQAAGSGVASRVPYWFAIPSHTPRRVTILYTPSSDLRTGARVQSAAAFRLTDEAGVSLSDLNPAVTVTEGNGSVTRVIPPVSSLPGVYWLSVRLGTAAGANRFHIQVGDAAADVVLTGR